MSVWCIVVSGGRGRRFGRPKHSALLAGRPIVHRSVHTARTICDHVVLVLPADEVDHWDGPNVDAVVAAGAERADSVRCGLAAVDANASIIVIHDAARPLASRQLFADVIAAVQEQRGVGAIPGLPVTDTIKRVETGRVIATVPRQDLVAVQTPQAFRADVLRAAHREPIDATDDAALVERIGGRVVVVAGEIENLKITHGHDLDRAEWLLARRESSGGPSIERPS